MPRTPTRVQPPEEQAQLVTLARPPAWVRERPETLRAEIVTLKGQIVMLQAENASLRGQAQGYREACQEAGRRAREYELTITSLHRQLLQAKGRVVACIRSEYVLLSPNSDAPRGTSSRGVESRPVEEVET